MSNVRVKSHRRNVAVRGGGGSARNRSRRPHGTTSWRFASITPLKSLEIRGGLRKKH